MTSTSSLPVITIRPATSQEYLEVARVLYTAQIANPMIEHLLSKVEPATWFEFNAGKMKKSIEERYSSLVVAQRTDTEEIVGVVWSERFNKDHWPQMPCGPFPKGYNQKERELIAEPELQFIEEIIAKYGDIVCESCSL